MFHQSQAPFPGQYRGLPVQRKARFSCQEDRSEIDGEEVLRTAASPLWSGLVGQLKRAVLFFFGRVGQAVRTASGTGRAGGVRASDHLLRPLSGPAGSKDWDGKGHLTARNAFGLFGDGGWRPSRTQGLLGATPTGWRDRTGALETGQVGEATLGLFIL